MTNQSREKIQIRELEPEEYASTNPIQIKEIEPEEQGNIPLGSFSALAPEQQAQVKEEFFKQMPHIPKNFIGDMIFNLAAKTTEPSDWGAITKAPPGTPKFLTNKQGQYELGPFGMLLNKMLGESSGFPTFARSTAKSLGKAITGAGSLVTQTNPGEGLQKLLSSSEEDEQHPVAKMLGKVAGYASPIGAELGLTRAAIPAWGKFAETAGPSIVRRLATNVPEGALAGATFSQPGERAQGALEGGAFGGLLGEIAPAFKTIMDLSGKIKGISNIESLKGASETASQQHEVSEDALRNAKEESYIEHGADEPKRLTRIANQSKEEIGNLTQKLNEMGNPENAAAPLPGELNVPSTGMSPQETENLVPAARKSSQKAEQEFKDVDQGVRKLLNEGQEHHVVLAETVPKILDANKSDISNEYENIKKDWKDKDVTISDPVPAHVAARNFINSLEKDGERSFKSKNAVELYERMERMRTQGETIPADEYLTTVQTAKKLESDAWKNAYKTNENGGDAEYREQWHERAQEISDRVSDMEKALEEGVGTAEKKRLSETNGRWRDEVIPLVKNRTFNQMKYGGQAPSNIMQSISGFEPGNVLIQKAIKSSPAATKAALGQRYASDPSKLHIPDEQAQQYMQYLPELDQLKAAHKATLENIEQANKNLEYAKELAPQQKQQYKEEQKVAQERKETADKISTLQKQVSDLELRSKQLRKMADQTNITLAEKTKREKAYKDAVSDWKKLSSSLLRLTGVGAGFAGLGYLNKNKGN